jgi:hypothetical protein
VFSNRLRTCSSCASTTLTRGRRVPASRYCWHRSYSSASRRCSSWCQQLSVLLNMHQMFSNTTQQPQDVQSYM